MKQNTIKIIKNRLKTLTQKKLIFYFLIKKSILKSKNINFRTTYFLENFCSFSSNFFYKKICNNNGKRKSVNKKIKISRTSINYFLIENSLSFYKRISNNSKYTIFFFKKFFIFFIFITKFFFFL